MHGSRWQWDETLYAGSAPFYSRGRLPYPAALAGAVRDALGLDGTGRLLDVGCGPGSLTLLLAPLFEASVGVDADGGMTAEARRLSGLAGPGDGRAAAIEWRVGRAEQLPADWGTFRAVTFAQSFHWMDQPLVARRVRGMLAADGTWVHVHPVPHRGAATGAQDALPHPSPPWPEINALIGSYLGPVRRAGRSTLPDGTASGEEDVMLEAGFTGPRRVDVTGGQLVRRSADDIVAAVFSLSSSAPHLFGDRLPAFEVELRALLRGASPDDGFCEQIGDVELVLWTP